MTAAAVAPIATVIASSRVVPGVDVGRPITAAVLSNPTGGFNRRRDHMARARREAAAFDAVHVEAANPEEIYRVARELDADGVELLIVNGGDGTLQMVLTALFAEERMSPPPLLVLVAGGTSNTAHCDVGWGKRPPLGIRTALAAAASGRLEGCVVQRPVMLVESPVWDRPMCAMQFSAGAIHSAVKFAKREVEGRGARGAIGPAVTIAWFVLAILTGRSGEMFPPMQVKGTLDKRPLRRGALLGVLISTLDQLFLGIRPFWDTGPGRVRYSALAYRPRRFPLALWPLLNGRRGRFVTPENGYTSINADLIDLEIDGGIMLDGELFDIESAISIRISAPASASFLRGADPGASAPPRGPHLDPVP